MRLFHFQGRLRGPELYATGSTHRPRWALDGGNGSVASVDGMTDNEVRMCWGILRATLACFDGFSLETEQISQLMDALEDQIKDR